MISYDSHTFQPLKHEIFSLFVLSRFITEMKSQDLRKTVMRMTDDGLSSRQIAQQLRNVVTKSTVQRWQISYRKTNKIDLEKPPGRPKDVRTKNVIRKVKERLKRKPRQSARKLAKRLDISERSMNRIIKDDLHLHAYHVTIEPKLSDLHKKQRLSFAYWVRKNLRIADHRKFYSVMRNISQWMEYIIVRMIVCTQPVETRQMSMGVPCNDRNFRNT